MNIGLPREVKIKEYRVALTPSGVEALVRAGHTVYVETGAGVGSGFPDEAYQAAGGTLTSTAKEIFEKGELIVKVKEPQPAECALLKAHHILFTYLHLAALRDLTIALKAIGLTAIGYETIEVAGKLPLLEPMSEVAGRMSILVAAQLLSKNEAGPGILMTGVPGVMPAQVLVLGGGASGLGAAKTAKGLGAHVILLEINGRRIRELEAMLPGVHILQSTRANLAEHLPHTDALIGTVLLPGAKAPRLVDAALLSAMKPGSIFVDISIDQGGCSTTSRPTTHEAPTYVEAGVTHYCVTNMPGAYAKTSTVALTNATFPYVLAIANEGVTGACKKHPELVGGINVQGGKIVNMAVMQAHAI